jgi:hypothetical protein
LFLSIASIAVVLPASAAGVPKILKKAEKSLDVDDPVQVAVFEAVNLYEEGFEGILGEPLNAEERDELINWIVAFPDVANKGRMQRLRDAEVTADSARHVTHTFEGQSNGVFYVQNTVLPGATTDMHLLQWIFDVPFDERVSFAHNMFSSIQVLFAKDKKWLKSGTEDSALNPVYGQLSLVNNVKVGLRGSEMVMVSVDYGQTEEIHNLSSGVLLNIYRMKVKF